MAESSNPAEDFLARRSYQGIRGLDRQPAGKPPFWKTFSKRWPRRAPGTGRPLGTGTAAWLEIGRGRPARLLLADPATVRMFNKVAMDVRPRHDP